MFLAFLRNMPVNLFAVAMAFCGLTSAWRSVANYYDFHLQWISETFAVVALVLFVVISTLYGLKCFHAFSAVRKEWQDPISVNFFATLPLTLLLIPTVLYRYLPEISFWMWCLGAVLMFLFAWYMISRWLRVRQHPTHVTPGWILPVVGTVNIPAFAHLSHIPIREEIGTFALAIGLFFAIPLITLIMYQLIIHDPIDEKLRPTLMVLLAPFAGGYNGYISTFGSDTFAHVLYFLALFLFAILMPQIAHFWTVCEFKMSWWGVSFPLAAFAGATITFSFDYASYWIHILALAALGIISLLLLYLTILTGKKMVEEELHQVMK